MQIQDSGAARKCEAYLFDCFEASLKRGDLLHRGEWLRVQDLPFRMLVALLERPGELVTKEELAKQLWGDGVFTDVDQSLWVTATKLRRVLGDDANHPRYIKTVSGRGYKFIESVTPVFTPAAEIIPALSAPPIQAGPLDVTPHGRAAPRFSRTLIIRLILASFTIVLLGTAVT